MPHAPAPAPTEKLERKSISASQNPMDSESYRNLVFLRGEVVHLSIQISGRENDAILGDTIRQAYQKGVTIMRRRIHVTPKLIESTLLAFRRDGDDRELESLLYGYANALHHEWCRVRNQPADDLPSSIPYEMTEAWIAQMYTMIGMPELLIRPARLYTLPI